MQLVDDKIAIIVDDTIKQSAGGITIVNPKAPQTGTVYCVGPGRLLRCNGLHKPVAVKSGQKVAFSAFSGIDIEVKGKQYKILSESDILAYWD